MRAIFSPFDALMAACASPSDCWISAEAEALRLVAEANADAIRKIAEAVRSEGGAEAVIRLVAVDDFQTGGDQAADVGNVGRHNQRVAFFSQIAEGGNVLLGNFQVNSFSTGLKIIDGNKPKAS
jgi:hypothetical protein